jgi:hypothetical protein
MVYGNSKRIVVVKDIPSNIIEEAILILKHEPGKEIAANISAKAASKKDGVKVNTDLLLKEAEIIINSYINEGKLQEKYPRKIVMGKKVFPQNNKFNLILNAGLVISAAFLLFVLSKFI